MTPGPDRTVETWAQIPPSLGAMEPPPEARVRCSICGGAALEVHKVLQPALVATWGLSAEEEAYINRQQGDRCRTCGASVRSMALAQAIAACVGPERRLLPWALARRPWLKVLEINQAGQVSYYLRLLPRHQLVEYPAVDMQDLPFRDRTFDLVVHSDTLEHVEDAAQGLRESLRVLKPGGHLCFTVPMVVGRLTRQRTGLPPSYHGSVDSPEDYPVFTEYGADAWLEVLRAGFVSCTIHSLELPAGLALRAQRPHSTPTAADALTGRALGLAKDTFMRRRRTAPSAGPPGH